MSCTFKVNDRHFTEDTLKGYIKNSPNMYAAKIEELHATRDGSLLLNPENMEDMIFEPSVSEYVYVNNLMKFKSEKIDYFRGRVSFFDKEIERITNSNLSSDSKTDQIGKLLSRKSEAREEIVELEAEISSLVLDTAFPIVSAYVNRDIDKAIELSKSGDENDMILAVDTLKFYIEAGNFSNPDRNIIFTREELVDDDGQEIIDSNIKNLFTMVRARSEDAIATIKDIKKQSVIDVFKENDNIKKMYGDTFTDDFIFSTKGLNDVSIVDSLFYDITQGIRGEGTLIPQMIHYTLTSSIDREKAKLTNFTTRLAILEPQVLAELNKRSGKSGALKNFETPSFDIFYQKSSTGEPTGKWVQRMSYKFQNTISEINSLLANDLAMFHKQRAEAKATGASFNALPFITGAYQSYYDKLKKNAVLLDLTLVPELASEFPEFTPYFSTDTVTIDSHKKKILDQVDGNIDAYNEFVEDAKKKLSLYYAQYKIEKEIYDENYPDPTRSKIAFQRFDAFEKENNPFRASFNIDSTSTHQNTLNYNTLIPLKGKDFYDPNFREIETSPVLKEFQNILMEFSETMYNNASPQIQKSMTIDSVAYMEKSFWEILTEGSTEDKRLLSRISAAYRKLLDTLYTFARNEKQSSISKAPSYLSIPEVNDSFLKRSYGQVSQKLHESLLQFKTIARDSLTIDTLKNSYSLHKKTVMLETSLSEDAYRFLLEKLGLPIDTDRNSFMRSYGTKNIKGTYFIRPYQLLELASVRDSVKNSTADLFKMLRYYSAMTAEYAARQSALPTISILKEYYDDIQEVETTITGDTKIDRNSLRPQDDVRMKPGRARAKSRMEEYFKRVVLNKPEEKHLGQFKGNRPDTIYYRVGKRYPALAKWLGTQSQDGIAVGSEIAAGNHFKTPRYTREEREKLKIYTSLHMGIMSNLSNGDYMKRAADNELATKIQSSISQLGGQTSVSSFINSMLEYARVQALGWNVKSQITNLLEGGVANAILASKEEHFSLDSYYKAKQFVNKVLVTPNKFLNDEDKVKKEAFNSILKRWSILQDNTNELQKASVATKDPIKSKWEYLKPFKLTAAVEVYNQSPIAYAVFNEIEVTSVDGKSTVPLLDALDNNGLLRPEYSTAENIKNFNELNGNRFREAKLKIDDAITRAHGNYSDLRGVQIKSNIFGKMLMMFKTWMTSSILERIQSPQDNIYIGKKGQVGRYYAYTPGSAFVFGAIAGIATGGIGFLPVLIGGGSFSLVANILGTGRSSENKSNIPMGDFVRDMSKTSYGLFKMLVSRPINIAVGKNKIKGVDVSSTDMKLDTLTGVQKNFTMTEYNRLMRSNMVELSNIMLFGLMKLAVMAVYNSLFGGDEEDEDTKYVEGIYNYLMNTTSQIMTQATAFASPTAMYKSMTEMAPFRLMEKASKILDTIYELETNPKATREELDKTLASNMPAALNWFGFGASMRKEYGKNPFDGLFISENEKNKLQYNALKKQYEEYLTEQGDNSIVIKKKVNRVFKPLKKNQTISKERLSQLSNLMEE